MIQFIKKVKQIFDKYSYDEMTVYAAQASFFIVLSSFPFIMLLLALIQLIPTISKADLLANLVSLLPDILDPLVVNIINDLYTKSPGTVLSLTAITALWSAARGMLSMERGLNRILEIKEKRNYFVSRIFCAGYTIIFMLTCIVSLLLLVFGNTIQAFIQHSFPIISSITSQIINFRALFALALLIVCFTGLYTFLPYRKLSIRSQLPGAIFSTIGWILFSYGFSIYFENFSNYSYMYGSLTAIVLLMLWLYICICLLFFGAEINHYYSSKNIGVDR